eukprot:198404_1
MFSEKKFVISEHEADKERLVSQIKKEKGKVQKTITKYVDCYVQSSWNTDPKDDYKLGKCTDYGVQVVPSHYILHCISVQSVIPFNFYALDECKSNSDKTDTIWTSLTNSKCFAPPCEGSLERESFPQSIQEFNESKWTKPILNQTDTIYILPIHSQRSKPSAKPPRKKRKLNQMKQAGINGELLRLVSDFVSAYFQLNVKILDAITMNIDEKKQSAHICVNKKRIDVSTHNDEDGHTQYEVCDIIDAVLEVYQNVDQNKTTSREKKRRKKNTLQDSGYCIIGITNEDIFEHGAGWGALRGRAFGGSAVAVLSVFHYYDVRDTSTDKMLMLLNTMAHELLHCFGMDHCTFYLCVMTAWCDVIDEYGKGNEVSIGAMHLCPIDLKKLHLLLPSLDVSVRYKMLHAFYKTNKMIQQAEWIENVLSCCSCAGNKEIKRVRTLPI